MPHPLFAIDSADRATVIRLALPRVIDSQDFDELNDAMLSLVTERSNHSWIIDLAEVDYMGSAMLGLMVNLRQRIKIAKGRLVLCSMPPTLMQIFRTCCMERLFVIARSRDDAIAKAG